MHTFFYLLRRILLLEWYSAPRTSAFQDAAPVEHIPVEVVPPGKIKVATARRTLQAVGA